MFIFVIYMIMFCNFIVNYNCIRINENIMLLNKIYLSNYYFIRNKTIARFPKWLKTGRTLMVNRKKHTKAMLGLLIQKYLCRLQIKNLSDLYFTLTIYSQADFGNIWNTLNIIYSMEIQISDRYAAYLYSEHASEFNVLYM